MAGRPIKVLNVAEKPSVAKEVTAILSNGANHRRQGASQYNALYDFNYSLRNGTNLAMTFTSVTGHLMELDFTAAHKNWHADPTALFTAPVVRSVPEKNRNVAQNLAQAAKGIDWLVLWLDCDTEGEAIAFEVVDAVLDSLSATARKKVVVKRAHFSALIPRDIHAAMNSLTPPNQAIADSATARAEIDLRLGCAFTRWQTVRWRGRFEGLNSTISYGPCQFPTLGFIVERYLRRASFVPEDFWSLKVVYAPKPSESVEFTWRRGRLFLQHPVAVLEELCNDNPTATVTSVSSKPRSKWKPLPLTTVEFQKRATRYLRIPAETAMGIAERLYQQGYLSYPRTETDQFAQGTPFAELIANQAAHPNWGQFASSLLTPDRANVGQGFAPPRNGKHNDNSHPPIHPVKSVNPGQLQGDEARVYELVTRHFLAACSTDARGTDSEIVIDIAGESFNTRGTMLTDPGYLQVYTWEKWSNKSIPTMEEGQTFVPQSITMTQGSTSAPELLTESDLIALMDANGIGTDATIAQHIGTVLKRNYAQKDHSSRFVPTTLGVALVQGYHSIEQWLAKPFLRARMEADMNSIASGNITKEQVITQYMTATRRQFDAILARAADVDAALAQHFHPAARNTRILSQGITRCGTCGGQVRLEAEQDGQFERRNFVCDTCALRLSAPGRGTLSSTDHVCPLCNWTVVSIQPEGGKRPWTVCPKCYTGPPSTAAAGDIEEVTGKFSCFQCAAPGCSLAGLVLGKSVYPCPKCPSNSRGKVTAQKIKPSHGGDPFVAFRCDKSGCDWFVRFPGTILSMALGTPCNTHSTPARQVYTLNLHFRNGQTPPGVDPVMQNACIAGCHPALAAYIAQCNSRSPHRGIPDWSSGRAVNAQNAPRAAPAPRAAAGAQWGANPGPAPMPQYGGAPAPGGGFGGGYQQRHPQQQQQQQQQAQRPGNGWNGNNGNINNTYGGGYNNYAGGGYNNNNNNNNNFQRNTAPIRQGGGHAGGGGGRQGGTPNCYCGRRARTAGPIKKEGPTKGKMFYVCASNTGSCKFWELSENAPPNTTHFGGGGARRGGVYAAQAGRGGRGGGAGAGAGGYVGQKRPFNGGGAAGAGGYNQNAAPAINYAGVQPPAKKQRCCSVCKQPGHTKNKCPTMGRN